MRKLYILTVDDAQFIRDLISKTIKNRFPDTQVDEARDGEEAQQMMEAFKYDLVLSELELPTIDGLELLTWTREHPVLYTQPFIIVSNIDTDEARNEAVQAGVSDYITKPFTSDQLINRSLDVLLKNELISENEIDSSNRPQAAVARERMATFSTTPTNKSRGILGKALVLYGASRQTFFIRDISLSDITLIHKGFIDLPTLRQECLVGVVSQSQGETLKMSIKSFCYMTQLLDKDIQGQTTMIKLNFLPLDVDQTKLLNKIVNSLRS